MKIKSSAPLVLALVGACRSPSLGPPPIPRHELQAPSDFLPNDLDFVIRIDIARLRSEPVFADAGRRLATREGSSLLRSIFPMLQDAKAMFVGGRFMTDGFHGDGVIAIEPNGASLDSETSVDPSFRRIQHVPDHIAVFERSPAARDEAALEVMLESGGITLATPSEEDAVLRIIRSGPDVDRLDPPAHGLVSFAARASMRGATFLHGFGEGLARADGSIEAGQAIQAGQAFRIESELVYTSEDAASRAAEVLRSLLNRLAREPGRFQSAADSMRLAREAEVLRLSGSVPFAVFAEVH